jgi:hypothetical protein
MAFQRGDGGDRRAYCIANLILGVTALIEGIIDLTMSGEEIERLYVVGKKHRF